MVVVVGGYCVLSERCRALLTSWWERREESNVCLFDEPSKCTTWCKIYWCKRIKVRRAITPLLIYQLIVLCKTNVSDSVFGRIFFPLNAWIFACAFQFRSKTFPCIFLAVFLAGFGFVSEKKTKTKYRSVHNDRCVLFFGFLFKKIQALLKGKHFHPEKTLASVLHQAIPLLSTCFSLLFGRLSPHSWVPFKSPFSFKMQLTLRIMFLRRLKRETTPWVDYSSIDRNIKKFPFQQALNNQRNKSCFWQTSIEIFKEFPLD